MSGVKTIKHRMEKVMKNMKIMPKEKISKLFTGGWDAGFIAKKEHCFDKCLSVFVKYPNGAEYPTELIIRHNY